MSKNEQRELAKSFILKLSEERKVEAGQRAYKEILDVLRGENLIGSFSPLKTEVDLSLLNSELSQENRLALPKVEEGGLSFYLISDLSKDLSVSYASILEPIPSRCKKVDPNEISTLLVPGLAFDLKGNRLGRGKGFYDRFIAAHPRLSTIGVGFSIPLGHVKIPLEPHDQRLGQVFLY